MKQLNNVGSNPVFVNSPIEPSAAERSKFLKNINNSSKHVRGWTALDDVAVQQNELQFESVWTAERQQIRARIGISRRISKTIHLR